MRKFLSHHVVRIRDERELGVFGDDLLLVKRVVAIGLPDSGVVIVGRGLQLVLLAEVCQVCELLRQLACIDLSFSFTSIEIGENDLNIAAFIPWKERRKSQNVYQPESAEEADSKPDPRERRFQWESGSELP